MSYNDRLREASVWVAAHPGETACPACWLVHPEGACDR